MQTEDGFMTKGKGGMHMEALHEAFDVVRIEFNCAIKINGGSDSIEDMKTKLRLKNHLNTMHQWLIRS